ncbi:hypothetical protein SprV_0200673000 [Sparganum proliferum]
MHDGCVFEILRDFTLTPHLLEERSQRSPAVFGCFVAPASLGIPRWPSHLYPESSPDFLTTSDVTGLMLIS